MRKILEQLNAREKHIQSDGFRREVEIVVEKAFSSYHPSQYEGLHEVQKKVIVDTVTAAHRKEVLLATVALQQELLKHL